jgi:hypothetical protein
VNGNQTSYSESVANGTYYYQVDATNAGGTSAWTAGGPTVVSIPPPAPSAPTWVSAPPASSATGSFTLSWSSTGATSFTLQRSSSSSAGPWTPLVNGNQTSYSESAANGTYYYQVDATNAGGTSAWTAGGPTVVASSLTSQRTGGGGGGGCAFSGGDSAAAMILPLASLLVAIGAIRRRSAIAS